MANVNTALFGFGADAASAPEDNVLARYSEMEQPLRLPGLSVALRPDVEHIDLAALASAGADSTADSETWTPKFPIKVIAFEVVCASAAGATGTGVLQAKPSGGSFASISAAAVDVKTGAGVWQPGTVIDTSDVNLILTSGQLKFVFASGAGGALALGRGRIYFQRMNATELATASS